MRPAGVALVLPLVVMVMVKLCAVEKVTGGVEPVLQAACVGSEPQVMVTEPLKPPAGVTVRVEVAILPDLTVMLVGESAAEILGEGGATSAAAATAIR